MAMCRLSYRVWVLAILLALITSSAVSAHVVHLKNGKKLEGEVVEQDDEKVVIRTTFDGVRTVPLSDVNRVDMGPVPLRGQLDYRRKVAQGDAKELWDLHRWAKRQGFADELEGILLAIIELVPQDKRARKMLGHNQVDGVWMSPEEEAAHAAEKQRAEMEAKGLVLHEGKWITPEEKDAIERGLVRDGDDWITKDEWHRRRGEVKVDGKWVRLGEDEGKAWAARVTKDTRLGLRYVWAPHFDVLTELNEALTKRVIDAAEASYHEARRVLKMTEEEYPMTVRERIQLVLFKKAPGYVRFAKWFDKDTGCEDLSPGWVRAIQRQPSFYWVHPAKTVSAYVFPNTDKTFTSTVNHNVGLILLTRYNFNVRFPSNWLQEGFAYYLEMKTAKYTDSFALGSGASAPGGGAEAPAWTDSDKWKAELTKLVAEGRDPPLKRIARMGFDGFGYVELVKAWSVIDFLIQWDEKRFKKFIDATKVIDSEGIEADEEASLKEAYGAGYRKIDRKWREYVQNGFKL